jgi:hypothetical protein
MVTTKVDECIVEVVPLILSACPNSEVTLLSSFDNRPISLNAGPSDSKPSANDR